MGDKGFNQFSVCFLESRCAAVVRRIRFDQRWVQVVPADKDAKPVSQFWLSIIRTVLMPRLYRYRMFHWALRNR